MIQKLMLALLICSLITCTKLGKNISISGRVLNPITGEGIPNAKVSMNREKWSLSYEGKTKNVAETFTDADGYYELNRLTLSSTWIQVDLTNYYRLGFVSDGKTYYDNGTGTFGIKKGKKMKVDYHAVKYGKFYQDIQNINCQGINDTMQFRRKWQYEENFPENWSTYRTGCYSYISENVITSLPMGEYDYELKVTRNGVTNIIPYHFYIDDENVTTVKLYY